MAGFGGKGVGQVVVGFGSSGLGKALAAVAAAFLLRLFSGPGPELSPEMEAEDNDIEHQNDTDAIVNGKVYSVTIRWRNITCLLSDKSSTSVCFCETGGLVFLATDCVGELQLPEIATVEARDEYVNNILFKLGLDLENGKISDYNTRYNGIASSV